MVFRSQYDRHFGDKAICSGGLTIDCIGKMDMTSNTGFVNCYFELSRIAFRLFFNGLSPNLGYRESCGVIS